MVTREQAGCLVVDHTGQRVLLVTSRYSGAWILPKGTIDPGESARETAVRETAEEAGIEGILLESLGHFRQLRPDGEARIEVFVLRAEREHQDWPERSQRRRRWFTLEAALLAITRPELRQALNTYKTRHKHA